MHDRPCRPPSTSPLEDAQLDEFERSTRELAHKAKQSANSESGEHVFEQLVRILMQCAIRIARARLKDLLGSRYDPDDVLDVVNLSFFQLYRSIASYKPGTSVIPWFRTIVWTTALDFLREKHHWRAKDGPRMERMGHSAEQVPERDVPPEQVDVERVTATLSPDEQRVLDLVFRMGHSQREAAEIMGETESWVRSRVRKIRAAFNELR